jgi:hypothetical protein
MILLEITVILLAILSVYIIYDLKKVKKYSIQRLLNTYEEPFKDLPMEGNNEQ